MLLRINRCTDFNDIYHGDTIFIEENHRLLLYRDNGHTRERSRGQELYPHNYDIYPIFFVNTNYLNLNLHEYGISVNKLKKIE